MLNFSVCDFLREIIDAQIAKLDEQVGKLEGAKRKIEGLVVDLGVVRAELEALKKKCHDGSGVAVRVLFYEITPEGEKEFMAKDLKIKQKVSFKVKAVDEGGNEAQLENPALSLVSSDPSLATLTVGADGLSGEIEAGLKVGSVMLELSADAKIGEGEKVIQGSAAVNVLPGEAISAEIEFGEAQDPA